jgi:osmotically-inducible protein OsmY
MKKISLQKNNFLLLFLLSFILCSCVETVVVGSVAGGAISIREKSFYNTQKDVVIASKLATNFLANGLKNIGNSVDISVNEGRVLLTGIVRDANKAKLAQDLAWKIVDVKEVIDEIQIRQEQLRPRDFSSSLIDYFITLQLENKIFFNTNLHSINYKITTVDRTVYFLGIALDDAEMQNALDIASKINGVKKVVNHLVLVNDVKRRK